MNFNFKNRLWSRIGQFALAMACTVGLHSGASAQLHCLPQITNQPSFSITYDGWIGMDVIEVDKANGGSDGFLIAGSNRMSNQSGGSNDYAYSLLIRTDASGNVTNRALYQSFPDYKMRAFAVKQAFTASGQPDGFVFVASVNQPTIWENGGSQTKIVKVDDNLDVVWERSYGGTNKDALSDLIVDGDGNIVAVGHTLNAGHGGFDIMVIKLAPNGTELFNQTYGTSSDEFAYGILEDRFGGYAICGSSDIAGHTRAALLHTDDNGNQDWMYAYGNFSEWTAVSAFDVTQTRNGFAMTGIYGTNNQVSSSSPILIVTDDLGTYLEGYTYTSSTLNNGAGIGIHFRKPHATCPAEYYISGNYGGEAFTLHTGGITVKSWKPLQVPGSNTPGADPQYNRYVNGSDFTKANGFVMAGFAANDVWLARTASWGAIYNPCPRGTSPAPTANILYTTPWSHSTIGTSPMSGLPQEIKSTYRVPYDVTAVIYCDNKPVKDERLKMANLDELENLAGLSVFPNPNAGQFTLSLSEDAAEAQEVVLFDLSGKSVAELNLQPGQSKEVDFNGLPKGLYLARSSSGKTLKISVR